MKVTREHGLVLNKKKSEAKSNSVKFFGCVYDKQSVPRSIKGQRHQGDACPTEQRRASELPWNGNISLTIHPTTIFSHSNTRGLLKTDVEYSWNTTYQVAFDKLKSLVCEDTTLRYFNTKKPETIQVDASGKGLGATLIQDDGQSPLFLKCSHPQSSTMQTMRENYSPVSSVQNISGHMFLVDTS